MDNIIKQDFDIIICTNNRADSILILIKQILEHSVQPSNIIVIDSSDQENQELNKMNQVIYVKSSHKNQPYQRYVGYLASKSSILLYLDDDMKINNSNTMEIILQRFQKSNIIGLAINFINNNEFLEKSIPKSKFKSNAMPSMKNKFLKIIKNFTGQVSLNDGEYYYNGLKGKQPVHGGTTQWFSGGAFAVKKEYLYNDFNFGLFDLYENKLGKGEDGIIGYTLSKNGELYFEPDILFIHCDKKDSTYTKNIFSFTQKVVFSRYYLSREFARLNNKSYFISDLYYHWYILWRIIGLLVNQLLDRNENRKYVLYGYFDGWKKVLTNYIKKHHNQLFWIKEAENDIKNK